MFGTYETISAPAAPIAARNPSVITPRACTIYAPGSPCARKCSGIFGASSPVSISALRNNTARPLRNNSAKGCPVFVNRYASRSVTGKNNVLVVMTFN